MDMISGLRARAAQGDTGPSTEVDGTFSLAGRTAVVTGAASGIGRETARVLGRHGARVVAADIADLDVTMGELAEAEVEAVAVPTDVTDREAVESLAASAVDAFGSLGIWVNVAGVLRSTPLLDTDPAELDLVLRTNFVGTYWGVAAAARKMRRSGGSIVNVSSAGADMASVGIAAYGASKAAVSHLTRTAAAELGASGIRVNAVAPGVIDTPMIAYHWTAEDGTVDPRARIEHLRQRATMSPLGRTGVPADVAYAILYLASDAARFMTGQVLRPNGGAVMP